MKYPPHHLQAMARHALASTERIHGRTFRDLLIVRLMLRTGLARDEVVRRIVNLANT